MSKMREAFEEWADSKAVLNPSVQREAMFIAWKAAIAAVKEGGPVAWVDENRRLTLYQNLITPRFLETAQPLYKLPED